MINRGDLCYNEQSQAIVISQNLVLVYNKGSARHDGSVDKINFVDFKSKVFFMLILR